MSEKTVATIRSLEDSLAHVRTATVADDAEQERSESSAMSEKTVLLIRSLEDSLAHRLPMVVTAGTRTR